MPSFKKKKNFQTEEHFHDQWAKSVTIEELDVIAQFEGPTTPEYRKVKTSLGEIENKKILNIGSGLGEEAVYLALSGANVVAIDISLEMLEITKKLAKRYRVDGKIQCIKMSVEKMSFKDNSFDAVVGCNVLHHVNIKKTAREVKRVLKPKGIAVFAEPLAYNPLINVYRVIARDVRTDGEHPLNNKDLIEIYKSFPNSKRNDYHFSTLLIFVWFFLVKRYNPNKTRYWKKIIIDGKNYKQSFKFLYSIDKIIWNFFPFSRKYFWVTVITSEKNV